MPISGILTLILSLEERRERERREEERKLAEQRKEERAKKRIPKTASSSDADKSRSDKPTNKLGRPSDNKQSFKIPKSNEHPNKRKKLSAPMRPDPSGKLVL